MKYFHISSTKRFDLNGLNLGGVPRFAAYLKRAIPDLELISFYDYPQWIDAMRLPDYDKAVLLNEWLLEEGLGQNCTVICDGYWGKGLEGKVDRLISVCHGSYYGRFIQSRINPWGSPVNAADMENQFALWTDPKVEVVCVAEHALWELELAGIADDYFTVISLGVDLDVFCPPRAKNESSVFMHGAEYALKGADIINAISRIVEGQEALKIEALNEPSGDDAKKVRRICQAVAMISPSRYEGNPYLIQESLACGVPIIAHQVGAICDMDARVGYTTDDLAPANFIRLMRKMLSVGPESFDSRGWAEESCDYKDFERRWRQNLGYTG